MREVNFELNGQKRAVMIKVRMKNILLMILNKLFRMSQQLLAPHVE